ncbi:hypothetical protein DITRI_Ditri03aG0196000 [Diplodiscus trichospermus]
MEMRNFLSHVDDAVEGPIGANWKRDDLGRDICLLEIMRHSAKFFDIAAIITGAARPKFNIHLGVIEAHGLVDRQEKPVKLETVEEKGSCGRSDDTKKGLPVHFCKRNHPNLDEFMALIDEAVHQYPTVYLARKPGFSGGWRGFVVAQKFCRLGGL